MHVVIERKKPNPLAVLIFLLPITVLPVFSLTEVKRLGED